MLQDNLIYLEEDILIVNPYFLMTLLFMSLAGLIALDNSLASFSLISAFSGLRWLRVHFITLGTLTEAAFWLMPALVAARRSLPAPRTRWGTWLALNAGLITLLIGIPLVNGTLILTGGTLIFVAVLLLIKQLSEMGQGSEQALSGQGRPFYIAALSYLLLGIIVGTGLWLGWGARLGIKVPIEVHIHANSWGFISFLFAGLLIDVYPRVTGKQLAWPRSTTAIFWLLALGALGLVLGPWTGSMWFTAPGLLMHSAGTILLLANVVKPMRGERWSAGLWHIVTSYFWFWAPVLVAPLILAGVTGFPGAGIEQNAPQALVYGWMLQFGFALLPFFFQRVFLPQETPRLGGNWFSLIAMHLGSFLFWSSIFLETFQGLLQGVGYALWAVALLPVALDIWSIVRRGLAGEEVAPLPQGGVHALTRDPSGAD
jgi:hypothetical protein